jgi:glycosyltransferase involved in cell wall biosynthesis
MPACKVLFLVNTLRTGGTERNVASICRHIDRTRFEPEVWVLQNGGEWEETVRAAGVAVRNLDRGWAHSPSFTVRAARQIAQTNADLVHVFLPSVGFYAATARFVFNLGKPIIVSVGATTALSQERFLYRWFGRCFDRAIANSASVREMLRGFGFQDSKIALIPNGHDCEAYDKPLDRAAIRDTLGVQPNEKMVVFVGRLIDTKRIGDALAAVARVRSLGHRIRFVIVGDGPERPELESLSHSLSLDQAVIFAGKRGDVIELLRSADLFLFPSETEGLSNAVIEACLARLPIVACAVPGVADIVRHNEEALLAPPRNPGLLAEALDVCLRQPALAERLAAAAHERAVRDYSIGGFLARLYDTYDDCLRTSQRSAS